MTRLTVFLAASTLLFVLPSPALAQGDPFDEEAPQDAEEEELSPEEEIAQRLEAQRITLNFDETPFDEALNFFRDITGLSIVVDGRVAAAADELQVSLRLKDISLKNALLLVLACDEELVMEVWCGVVYVKKGDTKLPEAKRAGEGETGQILRDRTVALNFEETPFEDVIQFLQDITGLEVQLDDAAAKAVEDAVVSLQVRELSLESVLNLLTLPRGLTWNDGEVLTITTAE